MRLRIGSGFGIPVYLHWTFFLLPLWILLSQPSQGESELALVFTLVPLVFLCVVLHEFGHALTARWFGIGTQDITLYPIGGVARLKRMSDKPHEELIIAVAGPAVNVVIAGVLFCIALPLLVMHGQALLDSFPGKVGLVLLWANVILVLFNLVPAFPMDGGRVLRAVLAWFLDHFQATRIAVGVGVVMAALMAAAGLGVFSPLAGLMAAAGLGVFSPLVSANLMLVVLAAFVFFAGQQELAAARYREQQRYAYQQEEPLEVLPVLPVRPYESMAPKAPLPNLIFQPKISVYTWDNQTGLWRKDPASPS
jgi:Zn-dependent protease